MRGTRPLAPIEDCYVLAGGVRTHYLEAGEGPVVVLLHAGEFGASAELSWELVIPALAESYRVVAPDWLGYGETEKIYDFANRGARRLRHISDFLESVDVTQAAFVGNSMGGTALAKVAASGRPDWPIRAAVLISGGGFVPDNAHRQALISYDGTEVGMRAVVEALFHDPRWAEDDEYVARRHRSSLVPGAWECAAAARLRAPNLPERSDFGQPDTTVYEEIGVPVLLIAGAEDKLRLPGYADELVRRIPDARLRVLEGCGHCPNVEQADRVAEELLAFLDEVHPDTKEVGR